MRKPFVIGRGIVNYGMKPTVPEGQTNRNGGEYSNEGKKDGARSHPSFVVTVFRSLELVHVSSDTDFNPIGSRQLNGSP